MTITCNHAGKERVRAPPPLCLATTRNTKGKRRAMYLILADSVQELVAVSKRRQRLPHLLNVELCVSAHVPTATATV